MKMFALLVVAGFATAAIAQSVGTLPGMVFHEGLYGHDGTCVEVRRPVGEARQACQDRIGVLVTPGQTSFMFGTEEERSVIFRSQARPEHRNDNDLAIYVTTDVLDMSDRQVYQCPGECRVESRRDGVSLECTAWKKADRMDTCASGRFLGNGLWMYKPPAAGAPGEG